jgi:hypothetical protein
MMDRSRNRPADDASGAPGGSVGRFRGERGQAYVLALVVLFTFTGAAAIWLARDVNQRVSDRSAIQSIAFQAARAGAQQIDVSTIRGESGEGVVIDEQAARTAAVDTARRLSAHYELDTQIVSQGYEGGRSDIWAVTVAIPDGRADVTSADLDEVMWVTGIAHAETGG